jgi:type II secretory pathway component PulM
MEELRMSEQTGQPTPSQPAAPRAVVPLRALVINLLFSMFTSLVIFTVASYYFLVPQIVRQDAELQQMRQQLSAMDQRALAEEAEAEDARGEDALAAEQPAADEQGVAQAADEEAPAAEAPAATAEAATP